MSVQDKNSRSSFASGCFYAAFYLCIGATLLFAYQAVQWLREGAWIPQQVSTLLGWLGLQQPPAILWSVARSSTDRVWGVLGNCPITIMLSAVALCAALLGYAIHPASKAQGPLRGAH